jgi:Family of unknown function (DUF6533)
MAGTTDVRSLLVTLQDLRIINYNMGEHAASYYYSTHLTSTVQVCTTALLAYDIIITSGQEHEYLWR